MRHIKSLFPGARQSVSPENDVLSKSDIYILKKKSSMFSLRHMSKHEKAGKIFHVLPNII